MIDQNLIAYIREAQSHNQTKEQMYKDLLAHGWSIDDIQAAFASFAAPAVPRPQYQAPTPVPVAPKTVIASAAATEQKGPTNVIVTIGALLIAAGVFSFIAANWQGMSNSAKMIVILVAMVGAYALGWYLKERKHLSATGEASYLLGSFIYGGGIFLVAQMFNIRANWPDGFILWMLGALIMGMVLDSYPVMSLAVIVGIIAVVAHPFIIFDSFSHNAFLMTSSLLLLVAAGTTIWAGLAIRKRIPDHLKNYL